MNKIRLKKDRTTNYLLWLNDDYIDSGTTLHLGHDNGHNIKKIIVFLCFRRNYWRINLCDNTDNHYPLRPGSWVSIAPVLLVEKEYKFLKEHKRHVKDISDFELNII